MKRFIAILAVLAVAGCSTAKLDETKAGITDACAALDDATVTWIVDFIAETTGLGQEAADARAKRQELCATAAKPVEPAGELSPIPPKKPTE